MLQNHAAHDKYHQQCRAVQTARHMYKFYLQRSNIIWKGNFYETPSYEPLLISGLQLTVIQMVKRSPTFIKPEGTLVHRLDLILSHLNAVYINLILIIFHLSVSPTAVFLLEILLINILHAFFSLQMNVPCATNPILLLELLTSFLHVWRMVILHKQLLAYRASRWKTNCVANLQSTNIILHLTR